MPLIGTLSLPDQGPTMPEWHLNSLPPGTQTRSHWGSVLEHINSGGMQFGHGTYLRIPIIYFKL